ncbi:Uncharacterised protein [Enterobacter hormaechei]|nr:Uncharacterised protein [Enterobacter hormaechei]
MRGVDDGDLFLRIERHPAPLYAASAIGIGERAFAFGGWRGIHSLIGQVIPQAGALAATDDIRQLPDFWFFRLVEQRRGFGRERLRRRENFALDRTITLRNRTFFDWPYVLPRQAVNHKQETLLGGLNQRRDLLAVYGDVHQRRGGVNIVIPDVVVYPLTGPDHFTSVDVQRGGRGAKRNSVYAVAAPVVGRRRGDREIDQTVGLIGGHVRPDVGGTGTLADLCRDRLKGPLKLTGLGVD